jgi:hypothetical protein
MGLFSTEYVGQVRDCQMLFNTARPREGRSPLSGKVIMLEGDQVKYDAKTIMLLH